MSATHTSRSSTSRTLAHSLVRNSGNHLSTDRQSPAPNEPTLWPAARRQDHGRRAIGLPQIGLVIRFSRCATWFEVTRRNALTRSSLHTAAQSAPREHLGVATHLWTSAPPWRRRASPPTPRNAPSSPSPHTGIRRSSHSRPPPCPATPPAPPPLQSSAPPRLPPGGSHCTPRTAPPYSCTLQTACTCSHPGTRYPRGESRLASSLRGARGASPSTDVSVYSVPLN